LIICNEVAPEEGEELQASVQLVDLADGTVTDMLTGLVACDPATRTPWATVIVAEETDDGRVYEIIDPLEVTGVTVDRDAATTSDPRVVARPALGQLAYEGIVILPDGTMYYGDERRPLEGVQGAASTSSRRPHRSRGLNRSPTWQSRPSRMAPCGWPASARGGSSPTATTTPPIGVRRSA
jgi:hypothetical protein